MTILSKAVYDYSQELVVLLKENVGESFLIIGEPLDIRQSHMRIGLPKLLQAKRGKEAELAAAYCRGELARR